MTAQAPDILYYLGKKRMLFSNPLESYWGVHCPRPLFRMANTGNWRGYTATWKITADDRLYLIGLQGSQLDEESFSFAALFPGQARVFADWVNEKLNVPYGKQLQYVHMGYGSVYEKHWFLQIEYGVLVQCSELDGYSLMLPPRPPSP